MPHLRFSKDGRGYENTFVVHSPRGKGKSRPRIIYWFRTPPNVKVGRTPLDDEAVKRIESAFPDVSFDWPQLLKGRQEPAPERQRPEPGGRSERSGRPERGDRAERRERGDRGSRPERADRAPKPEPAEPRASEPAPVEPEPAAADPARPAEARLGAAGLRRLRARYTDIQARIRDRVDDETRRAELNAAAERLNPDSWITDEDVLAGIEAYEATFEAVKTAIGGRRKPAEPEDPENAPV